MIANKLERNFKKVVVVFLFLFLSFISGFLPGFDWDVLCWANWSSHMYQHGLSQTYDAYLNTYMPVYQYILYAFGKIAGSEEAIRQHIGYVRIVTLLFEFAGLWYVYKWIDKKLSYHLVLMFAMLNIAYAYNTMIWGQVDGISSALGFATMYYGTTRRPLLSALFMLLAINMKLQMIIFVPVWGLLNLYNIAEERSWKTFLFPLLIMVAAQVLLLVPFMFYETGLQQVYNAAFTSVGQFPKVSAFAFNIWYWICPTNPSDTLDSGIFILNLSYKNVGLLLFFLSSFLVMLPLMAGIVKKTLGKETAIWPSREHIWLVCSLIPLFFFFF